MNPKKAGNSQGHVGMRDRRAAALLERRAVPDEAARVVEAAGRADHSSVEALQSLELQVQAARNQDAQSAGAFIPFRRTH
jgi:hypothetical protein